MALVECPDCGKKISDRAASCNECGRPMEEPKASGQRAKANPNSADSQSVKAGNQRSKLRQDTGMAIGGLSFAVGVVVMFIHLPTGLGIAAVGVGIGLWIQYGS